MCDSEIQTSSTTPAQIRGSGWGDLVFAFITLGLIAYNYYNVLALDDFWQFTLRLYPFVYSFLAATCIVIVALRSVRFSQMRKLRIVAAFMLLLGLGITVATLVINKRQLTAFLVERQIRKQGTPQQLRQWFQQLAATPRGKQLLQSEELNSGATLREQLPAQFSRFARCFDSNTFAHVDENGHWFIFFERKYTHDDGMGVYLSESGAPPPQYKQKKIADGVWIFWIGEW